MTYRPLRLLRELVGGERNLICYLRRCYAYGMSCQMIRELFESEFNIRISRQTIWEISRKHGLGVGHSDAMKLRVINDRIDYTKVAGKIDYENRCAGTMTQPQRSRKLHRCLPDEKIKKLEAYAKLLKLTKSDAYKVVYQPKDQDASYIIQANEVLREYAAKYRRKK